MIRSTTTAIATIGLLLILAGTGIARAEPVDPAVEAEFRRVIETQLTAFRRDDGETAFAQASPEIRARFGTATRFMDMVRTAYGTVYRPRDYEFDPAATLNGRTAQPVRFTGPDGRGALVIYYMVRQPDGSWRIGGVELLPLSGQEA